MQRRVKGQKRVSYKSPEHRLEKNELVLRKTWGRCGHCGKPLTAKTCTVDHIYPKSKGGTRDLPNALPLCRDCNILKGNTMVNIDEFFPYASARARAEAKAYKRKLNKFPK